MTLTPRDSHNNVVPLWTFRKDLTIVPSVNATVPGAVTVTTPAQDAAGAVAATLTYVDTSGKLLSKEARAGTTTITIGKAVKQTVDTRFYPQVNVCLTNLDSNGFVTPGTTEVHLCDGSGHTIPSGSGYKVAAPALSTAGCPADGGGVCPSDAAGVKADFTNLTGDDIRALASTRIAFQVHDVYAAKDTTVSFTTGEIAFYGELKTHKGATNLGTSKDLFHTEDANAYCRAVVRRFPYDIDDPAQGAYAAHAILKGAPTGGTARADTQMASLYMGYIADEIHTGGDTNPEIFVAGLSHGTLVGSAGTLTQEALFDITVQHYHLGTTLPSALVFVKGSSGDAAKWDWTNDGPATEYGSPNPTHLSIGLKVSETTKWNLSDAYYVNNWPGTPYTLHKANGDSAYPYVTQVNYITGYICAASLH
ncbi:hypothetical protein D6F67_26460 [Salmonella enterica]|nr:hypothetical protein [Salmonella enterica]